MVHWAAGDSCNNGVFDGNEVRNRNCPVWCVGLQCRQGINIDKDCVRSQLYLNTMHLAVSLRLHLDAGTDG